MMRCRGCGFSIQEEENVRDDEDGESWHEVCFDATYVDSPNVEEPIEDNG